MIQEQLHTPKMGSYDLIVAGGGVAGTAACVAAARQGLHVLLMEKALNLGGLATIGLINYFEPLCNGRGQKIIGGLCEEFFRLCIKSGYDTVPKPWKNTVDGKNDDISSGTGQESPPRYTTRFSAPIFSMHLTVLMQKEGIDVLPDTLACRPVMEHGLCRGIIVENKSGRSYYACKQLIDATGDSDLLARAGVPVITGKNWFTYTCPMLDLQKSGEAVQNGDIKMTTSKLIGSNLYGKGHPEELPTFDGTCTRDIAAYIRIAHKMMLTHLSKTDRMTRDVTTLPAMPQFRTVRRLNGAYTLQENDQYKVFNDSIGTICDFTKRDVLYEIPYRCLYHPAYANILTAGRSISACGWAWDATRVIPPAILTGQAAGTAAAEAIRENTSVDRIDILRVQRLLSDTGVLIHTNSNTDPT